MYQTALLDMARTFTPTHDPAFPGAATRVSALVAAAGLTAALVTATITGADRGTVAHHKTFRSSHVVAVAQADPAVFKTHI